MGQGLIGPSRKPGVWLAAGKIHATKNLKKRTEGLSRFGRNDIAKTVPEWD